MGVAGFCYKIFVIIINFFIGDTTHTFTHNDANKRRGRKRIHRKKENT